MGSSARLLAAAWVAALCAPGCAAARHHHHDNDADDQPAASGERAPPSSAQSGAMNSQPSSARVVTTSVPRAGGGASDAASAPSAPTGGSGDVCSATASTGTLLPCGPITVAGSRLQGGGGAPVALHCFDWDGALPNPPRQLLSVLLAGANCLRMPFGANTVDQDIAAIQQTAALAAKVKLRIVVSDTFGLGSPTSPIVIASATGGAGASAAALGASPPAATPPATSSPASAPPPAGAVGGGFTVTPSGFMGPDGQPWAARGMNVDAPTALQDLPGLLKNFPGTNMIRLVANADTDTAQSLAPVIQAYTSKGIVVLVEDHADSQGGGNTGWYSSMAGAYANNPYLWLGTPNEPSAAQAANQPAIIGAIRAAGNKNPVAVELGGGWDWSSVPNALSQGASQLFVDAHIYDSSTSPGAAADYVSTVSSNAKAAGLPVVVGEFGNAMDGFTPDPNGWATNTAVAAGQQSGQIAGALAWSADNGYHTGADSLCDAAGCATVSGMGTQLQGWLSNGPPSMPAVPLPPPNTSAPRVAASAPAAPPAPGLAPATGASPQAWKKVASAFAGDDTVIGYDIGAIATANAAGPQIARANPAKLIIVNLPTDGTAAQAPNGVPANELMWGLQSSPTTAMPATLPNAAPLTLIAGANMTGDSDKVWADAITSGMRASGQGPGHVSITWVGWYHNPSAALRGAVGDDLATARPEQAQVYTAWFGTGQGQVGGGTPADAAALNAVTASLSSQANAQPAPTPTDPAIIAARSETAGLQAQTAQDTQAADAALPGIASTLDQLSAQTPTPRSGPLTLAPGTRQ